MTIKSLLVAGIAMVSLVSGAAFADVYMTGEEVAKLVAGKTIEGQYRECGAGKNDFREFYDESGQIRGAERACSMAGSWSKYQGQWEIKDGKFCVLLGSDRPSGCFDYNVDKDGVLTRYDAKGVANVRFTIYDGNPDHL
ncbi:hypothetical protein [Parvibaculum sp.]|uniref:hypothetical protein n=1 Tax=Parvibaculum sp. TaxID=2024848 RepID=UPI0027219313|nr:hypothetical protein [Parvibaculum sp.]MDO9127189.1 hypothetical protein [Parvibaculum sp.]MDP1626446.1 hypothetical protein [Parvibaculum sp.]MDP2150368.1 hypothetical protein [Parvibaculum sp.]MDP3327878.1 hypothetical protein [Parvibaculum sp.]